MGPWLIGGIYRRPQNTENEPITFLHQTEENHHKGYITVSSDALLQTRHPVSRVPLPSGAQEQETEFLCSLSKEISAIIHQGPAAVILFSTNLPFTIYVPLIHSRAGERRFAIPFISRGM